MKLMERTEFHKLTGQSEYLGLRLATSSLVLLCVSDKLVVYQFKALLILSVYHFKALLILSSLVFIKKLDILSFDCQYQIEFIT